MIQSLTMETFDKFISEHERVVIDFHAAWCAPCRMLGQELEEFEESHPEMVIGKVNVDEYPELFSQFGESSIPLLVFFKNGKAYGKILGYIPASRVWEAYNG